MANRATGLWVYAGSDEGGPEITPPAQVFVAPPVIPFGSYIVRIAGADGRIIGELRGYLEQVLYRADGYGAASMLVPVSFIIDAPYLIEFGNGVRIDFDNGLRPWVGVIDVPREVSYGMIRVQMYEDAYRLTWRLTGVGAVSEEDTSPSWQIIQELVARSGLPIKTLHANPAGSDPLAISFDRETLAAAIDRVRSLDPQLHYDVVADKDDKLSIRSILRTWRECWEDSTTDTLLLFGHNLVEPTVLEQGPIFNQVSVKTAVGGTVVDDTPPEGDLPPETEQLWTADEPGSQKTHGLRQLFVTLSDVSEETSPGYGLRYAREQAAALAYARRRVGGTSLNLAPGLWRNYGVGSKVRLEAYSPVAMAMEATVLSMEYVPGDGRLALVFDDVTQLKVREDGMNDNNLDYYVANPLAEIAALKQRIAALERWVGLSTARKETDAVAGISDAMPDALLPDAATIPALYVIERSQGGIYRIGAEWRGNAVRLDLTYAGRPREGTYTPVDPLDEGETEE